MLAHMLGGILMKRIALIALLALSGCETPEEATARAQISAACEAGDLQACAFLQQQAQQRRQAVGAALQNYGNNLQSSRPALTTCRPVLGQVQCVTQQS